MSYVFSHNFNNFLLFCWGSYTDLILVQWHRWSPHIPHQSFLTSAGANCHIALKWDSPSPAGKKNWISICRCQTISKPASVTSTINLCALLKEKDSFFPGPLCDGLVLFFKTSFADSYVLVTLHKVVCLSSEFIYAGKYTSKQVRIPSISFWCNQCFKSHN